MRYCYYVTHAYTHDNDEEIAALYLVGESSYSIGRRFGISDVTIQRALKRQGIPRRKGGPPRNWEDTEENRRALVAAYEAGESILAIAKRLRCRSQRIMRVLDESGLGWRHPGGKRRFGDEDAAEFARAYQAGETLTQIGRRYGVSYVVVRQYLLRAGVPMRPVGAPAFWTGERKAEAARRYQAGEQIKDIAAAIGGDAGIVSRILRDAGLHVARDMPSGADHHCWRGGRYIDPGGYVRMKVPDEDRHLADETVSGYVLEHRLVMARSLGRRLFKDETVHHKRSKTENQIENLELWVSRHPKGQRVEDITEWAEEMLRRYAPHRLAVRLTGSVPGSA